MATTALAPGQKTGTVKLDEGDAESHDLTPLVKGEKYVVKVAAVPPSTGTPRLKWKGGDQFAGGEFEATDTVMTLRVSEKDENPFEYTLELEPKEARPPLWTPAKEWHEGETVEKDETRQYRFPTESGKKYTLHVHVSSGSVKTKIDGRSVGNMSNVFRGTGGEVLLEVTGSSSRTSEYKVWCSLKKT